MKLKYRITIGNVLVLIMVSFSVFTNFTSKDPNDLIGVGYLLFYSIFIFLADLFLQWIIDRYKKILVIEGFALAIILILLAVT
jgi:hypothetical protein